VLLATPSRLRALVGIISVALLVLPSCSAPVGSDLAQSPAQSPAQDDNTPTAIDARPLRRVPAVQPAGFTTPPAGTGLDRYASQQVDWRPCRQQLQCATVRVPLDYTKVNGSAITLAVAKKPATGSRRLGSLFINPGGPGGSGIDYLDYFRSAGLEGYDIVGWDPRGVGRSTPVSCATADLDRYLSLDNSPDDAAEERALVDAHRGFGVSCLSTSGPLLEHVSTVEVARDLDLLRGLVRDDRLNFFGASYGTRIGATYAHLFPVRVGRMVLDGAVNITADRSVTQAQGFDRALGAFATWCAARTCGLGRSRAEVLDSVAGLLSRLDGAPVRVANRRLTQQLAVAGVVSGLYGNATDYPFLAQALVAAIKGNGGQLLRAADALNHRDPRGTYGQINYAFPSVRCLDDRDRGLRGETERAAAANTRAPTLGPFIAADLQCAMWPVAAVPELELTGPGASPILVIGTTGDSATPYEHAVGMAKQLRSGVLLTFDGQGHTAYGRSACVQLGVQRYLSDGVLPRKDSRC
jgi:pimeloyl-ACP methyl ester carboxylesterase